MKKQILTIVMLSIAVVSFAHTYKGTVKDTQNKAIPFANVVLFSLPDSTFITGTTTEENGQFLLESKKKIAKGYLEVSFIGYETKKVEAKAELGTIILQEATNELGEVVVKAKRPKVRQKDGKLIVGIVGSSLSDAGTLLDVFKRTPGLKVENGNIAIFGKGTPLVFINGRQVQNASEYETLQSDEILSIEIDRNPSAKYSASSNSVVRITTKKITKDRINLQVYNGSYFARKFSNSSGVNLNSKWKKTQVSANYRYNFGKAKEFEDAYELKKQPTYTLRNDNYTKTLHNQKTHQMSVSLRQQIGDKHFLGGQFYYLNSDREKEELMQQKIKKTDKPQIQRELQSFENSLNTSATYNVNYHFDIDSVTKLNVLGDYSHKTMTEDNEISEENLNSKTLQKIQISNENQYDVYSARADFETVLLKKLPFQMGTKFSQVTNDGTTLGTDRNKNLQKYKTDNHTTDRIVALYMLLSPKLGKWNLEAGLRYEYTDRNVVATAKTILDTTYGKWFPSVNIARNFSDNFNVAFSYNKKISRPRFGELNTNLNYIDSLSYSVGNPKLKATITQNIAVNVGLFEKLFIGLEYAYNENDRVMTAMNDKQNQDITVYSSINLDKSEYLRADITYIQSYKFWNGTLNCTFEKPFAKIPYLNKMRSLNKIAYYLSLNNDFKISNKTKLFCNFTYSSPSEDLMSYYYEYYNISLGLNTSFFDEKLKLSLIINDILNSSDMAWKDQYGNIESYSYQDRDDTYFSITLKYNFNKYKGGIRKKIAGSEELNRM